jgi:hypothetical protein
MGWTGGNDTLDQVTLTFDTLDEAVRYAEQQQLAYRIEGEVLASSGEERRRAETRDHDKLGELYSTAAVLAYFARCSGVGLGTPGCSRSQRTRPWHKASRPGSTRSKPLF